MKQTLEEASKEAIHTHYNCNGEYPCGERNYCEHCNGKNTAFDCCECGADEFKEGFIAGAEWHANQSPWISVEERLPEEGQEVIVLYEYVSTFMVQTSFYHKEYEVWCFGDSKIIAWMSIPSFDEILEANRDVLERIKEKGN